MCGIVGVWHPCDHQSSFGNYLSSLKDRGPDASWECAWKGLGLGYTRLAIVNGPIPNLGAQSIDILLNGEIWNYKDLCKEADTEIDAIRILYVKHGIRFLALLEGIFAIAILDRRNDSFYLARDRFGVKPIYYTEERRTFFGFASDIKTLCGIPEFLPAIDLDFVANERVFGFSCNNKNLISGIRQLPPGTYLHGELRDVLSISQIARFSRPEERKFDALSHHTQQIDALEKALVRQYYHTDYYPIVILLSGGLDSSLLTLLSSRLGLDKIVCLYAGNKANPDYEWAVNVAKIAGYPLHSAEFLAVQTAANLPRLCYRSSGLSCALQVLAQSVRELGSEIRVVWCGEGADELYGGYPVHRKPRQYIKQMRSAIEAMDRQTDLMTRFLAIEDRVSNGAGPADEVIEFYKAEQLTNRHLVPFDASFMSCGLEVRVPFLDDLNVNFVEGLMYGSHFGIRQGKGKHLIEAVLREIAPLSEPSFYNRQKQSLPGAFDSLFAELRMVVAEYDWQLSEARPYDRYMSGPFNKLWLRLCEHILVDRRGGPPSIEFASDLVAN